MPPTSATYSDSTVADLPRRRAGRGTLVVALGMSLALAACSAESGSGTPAPTPASTTAASAPDACTTARAVAGWPLERRLAQLLIGGVATTGGDPIAQARAAVAAGTVSGLNLLGSNASAYASGELDSVIDAGGDVAPILAVDEEGGRVQRLREITGPIPSARVMGASLTPEQVRAEAKNIADTMVGLDLRMDLAPVLGVSSQPDSAVIGDRSFSDDPNVVTEYAGAFAQGLRDGGVFPVLKHFPGIGSATGNTDDEPASTPPLADLEAKDLIPYETLVKQQPVGVMMANAVVPDLTDGLPASLSKPAVDLLREAYGFDGLVMTDSLSAKAITNSFPIAEAAEMAIAAGVDVVLWDTTEEAPAILDRLEAAVEAGRIEPAQIDRSVVRMLDAKQVDACAS